MKILFKTTDRKQVNAQLRAFTKSANADLDLRKEAKEINWLTKIVTRFTWEYKGIINENEHYYFNTAMLVVTEYATAAIIGARDFDIWFKRREIHNRKMSFCFVMFNEKGEYILIDCTDMTADEATRFFNEKDKIPNILT